MRSEGWWRGVSRLRCQDEREEGERAGGHLGGHPPGPREARQDPPQGDHLDSDRDGDISS